MTKVDLSWNISSKQIRSNDDVCVCVLTSVDRAYICHGLQWLVNGTLDSEFRGSPVSINASAGASGRFGSSKMSRVQ